MSDKLIRIADRADMIVDGYAFTAEDDICKVIDLNGTENAMIIDSNDNVIETTMDDIEISIVMDIYMRNKAFMEI